MTFSFRQLSKHILFYTVPVSIAIHATLAFGIVFGIDDAPIKAKGPVFDVTIVIPQNTKAQKEADFFANSN